MPKLAVEYDETDMAELKLRVKRELWQALKDSAANQGVSLTAEIAMRLRRSFEMDQREAAQRELINQLSKDLSDSNARANRQQDMLLQLLARGMKLVPKDDAT